MTQPSSRIQFLSSILFVSILHSYSTSLPNWICLLPHAGSSHTGTVKDQHVSSLSGALLESPYEALLEAPYMRSTALVPPSGDLVSGSQRLRTLLDSMITHLTHQGESILYRKTDLPMEAPLSFGCSWDVRRSTDRYPTQNPRTSRTTAMQP